MSRSHADALMLDLTSFIEHPLDRSADRFVGSMDTPYPATGSAHPLDKLGDYPSHMILARLRRLDRDGPADPFIARKRGDVLPCGQRFRGAHQGLFQVCRYFVDSSRRYFHCSILPFSNSWNAINHDRLGRITSTRGLVMLESIYDLKAFAN